MVSKSTPSPKAPNQRQRWILGTLAVAVVGVGLPLALTNKGEEVAEPAQRAADLPPVPAQRPSDVVGTARAANIDVAWSALKLATGPALPRLPYAFKEAMFRFAGIGSGAMSALDATAACVAVMGATSREPYVVLAIPTRDPWAFDQAMLGPPLAVFEAEEHPEQALTLLTPRQPMPLRVARSGSIVLFGTSAEALLRSGSYAAKLATGAPKQIEGVRVEFDGAAVSKHAGELVPSAAVPKDATAEHRALMTIAGPVLQDTRLLLSAATGAVVALHPGKDSLSASVELKVGSKASPLLEAATTGPASPLLQLPATANAKAVWYMAPPEQSGEGQLGDAVGQALQLRAGATDQLNRAYEKWRVARGASNACALLSEPRAAVRCRFDAAREADFTSSLAELAKALHQQEPGANPTFGTVLTRGPQSALPISRGQGQDPVFQVTWQKNVMDFEEVEASPASPKPPSAKPPIASPKQAADPIASTLAVRHPQVMAALISRPVNAIEAKPGAPLPTLTVVIWKKPDTLVIELEADRQALWTALSAFARNR
ncbi:MAG: hypothetical protein R3B13_07835 [Polyangiaceae bacterium]